MMRLLNRQWCSTCGDDRRFRLSNSRLSCEACGAHLHDESNSVPAAPDSATTRGDSPSHEQVDTVPQALPPRPRILADAFGELVGGRTWKHEEPVEAGHSLFDVGVWTRQ